jgi:hypothetical protein
MTLFRRSPVTRCPYCQKPVLLQNCVADAQGRPCHSNCYLAQVVSKGHKGPARLNGYVYVDEIDSGFDLELVPIGFGLANGNCRDAI